MAASQTQVVGVAVPSYAKTAEGSSLMGANRTQGLGITAFLVGFTALSVGLYSGKTLPYLVAVASMAVSIWAFRKIKPLDNPEN